MSTDQSRPEPTDPTEPLPATDAGRPGDAPQPTEPIPTMGATQPIDTTNPTGAANPMAPTPPADTIELGSTGSRTTPGPVDDLPVDDLPAAATRAPEPQAQPAPAPVPAAVPATPRPDRPALRVGTVVWGLVLAVIGAGVIAVAAGAQFDLELAFIGLLVLAGVALLAGSIATSVRRRNR